MHVYFLSNLGEANKFILLKSLTFWLVILRVRICTLKGTHYYRMLIQLSKKALLKPLGNL